MTAQEKLQKKINSGFHVCVGLDTDINKIPKHLLGLNNPVLEFNKIVIENTCEHAAAYKINFAFYEKDGAKGFETILDTQKFIPNDVLTIADAKRGDIGNTSQMYAGSIYNYFNFDSVTLNPYMGFDSVSPFLEYQDKINFILSLTSNPSAYEFEKQKLSSGELLFQKVIQKVNEWNKNKNCGIVFGATKLDELKENINSFKDLFVLLPGIGSQGGSLEEVVPVFTQNSNKNFIINVSRSLLYADDSTNFGKSILKYIKDYNSVIKSLL